MKIFRNLLRSTTNYVHSLIVENLRSVGLFYCKGIIKLGFHNSDNFAKRYGGAVGVYKLTYQDSHPTNKPYYLAVDELSTIHPVCPKMQTVLLDITSQQFSLRNNHLVDEKRRVVYQPDIEFKVLPIFNQRLSNAQKVEGTVAYLSNTDTDNYYHWMSWILPLIHTYQKVIDLNQIDYFYLGEGEIQNFKRETLKRLGIKMSQVIQHGCRADRLIVAIDHRYGYGGGSIPKEIFSFTRNIFRQEIEDASQVALKRRLYVKRGNVKRRKVLNELEVIDTLKKYDFEPIVMDGLTVAEQASIFANAEAVVSSHGAALTNLFFVQPGTKVLEIFPNGYSFDLYYVLANHGKSDYSYLVGDNLLTEKQGNEIDLLVNIDKLKQICTRKFASFYTE